VKAVGSGGVGCTVSTTTGVWAEVSPPDFTRAATRITVPTAGTGPAST